MVGELQFVVCLFVCLLEANGKKEGGRLLLVFTHTPPAEKSNKLTGERLTIRLSLSSLFCCITTTLIYCYLTSQVYYYHNSVYIKLQLIHVLNTCQSIGLGLPIKILVRWNALFFIGFCWPEIFRILKNSLNFPNFLPFNAHENNFWRVGQNLKHNKTTQHVSNSVGGFFFLRTT